MMELDAEWDPVGVKKMPSRPRQEQARNGVSNCFTSFTLCVVLFFGFVQSLILRDRRYLATGVEHLCHSSLQSAGTYPEVGTSFYKY